MRGRVLTLAILAVTWGSASGRARADGWTTTLGDADTTVVVQGSDDSYPFCSTVDVATARRMARKRFSKARAASIAARGRAMEVLSKARWLRQLERLWVCTDERGLRALARVRHLRRLDVLEVASDDGEPLDGDAIEALVRSRGLKHLERLRFFGGDSEAERSIDSDGAVALATRARLPNLRFLDVSWNPIDPDAVAALVGSPLAHRLEELNLCRTAAAVDALIDARLTNLVRLCISDLSGGGGGSDDRERLDAAYPGVLSPQLDWMDEP